MKKIVLTFFVLVLILITVGCSKQKEITSTSLLPKESSLEQTNNPNTSQENQLDKVMIKWIENRKLNAHKSYYSPDEDETFKEITKLGIKYLPDILERIQKDDTIQTGVLMDAFSRISNVDRLKKIDVSEEGKKDWKQKCDQIMKNAQEKVRNASLKASNGDLESAKNEIKELGVFAVPYITDEIKSGNKKIDSIVDTRNYTEDELKTLKEMVKKSNN